MKSNKKDEIKPPFPYFGGKRTQAKHVWQRFGDDVQVYIEPFFGSGAVLFNAPYKMGNVIVNDLDANVCNFWRAVETDPVGLSEHLLWPTNECDLTARHIWLVNTAEERRLRVMGDPDYFDIKAAAWWCWGASNWIGSGWCTGKGPWQSQDGMLVDMRTQDGNETTRGAGVSKQLPQVIKRQGAGVSKKLPKIGDTRGRGVSKQLPGDDSVGAVDAKRQGLIDWMKQLQDRLLYTRVCCGDWSRVLGSAVAYENRMTAVFLDPPYTTSADYCDDLYKHGDKNVGTAAYEWAMANGDNPAIRIALCGYEGEYDFPDTWETYSWAANGGYGNQAEGRGKSNKSRERIWFSPHCIKV